MEFGSNRFRRYHHAVCHQSPRLAQIVGLGKIVDTYASTEVCLLYTTKLIPF